MEVKEIQRIKLYTRWRNEIEWLARSNWLAKAEDKMARRKLEEVFSSQRMRNGWR